MTKMTSDFLSPIGVIDIGSNSVRLMIPNGFFDNKNLIKKEQVITQLASGFSDGKLSADSMFNTLNAIKKLNDLALSKGAKKVYCFATAAVRNADNASDFIKLVKDTIGLDIHVVSGQVEATLAVLGALGDNSGIVIDIGGASSEVAYSTGGDIKYAKSHKIGAVSLYDKLGRKKEDIDNYLSSFIKEDSLLNFPIKTAYAIGGTATCLAYIKLGIKEYDATKVHGTYLSYEDVKNLKDFLFTLSPNDLIEKYSLHEKRAKVISGGASILLTILDKYNLKGVYVSEKDNLEGYLKYLEKNYEK